MQSHPRHGEDWLTAGMLLAGGLALAGLVIPQVRNLYQNHAVLVLVLLGLMLAGMITFVAWTPLPHRPGRAEPKTTGTPSEPA